MKNRNNSSTSSEKFDFIFNLEISKMYKKYLCENPKFVIIYDDYLTYLNYFINIKKNVLAKILLDLKIEEIIPIQIRKIKSLKILETEEFLNSNLTNEFSLDINNIFEQLEELHNIIKTKYLNIIVISNGNFSKINESKINEIKLNSENEYIQKLLPKFFSHIKETKELIKNNKREKYIFLLCKKRGKGELGYFHFSSLFNGLYRTNKEEFIIMLSSKELPNEKLLSESKCLIIPGSDLSVHNKLDFLRETEKFLKELIEDMLLKGKYPNLKILGICFGLEIIVSAFKGEIIKQPWSSEACYDIEKIFINKDFFNLDFVKKSKIEKTNFLYINEAHSESISKLPKFPKLNIFGYSNSCKYEVLVDENEKIFLIQGHPEYSPGLYLCKDIDYFMEIKKIEYNEENKKQFLNDYLNEEKRKNANFIIWRKLCWSFMKEH